MKSIITLFILSTILSSCSIFKSPEQETVKPKFHDKLNDLVVKAKISADMPERKATVKSEIKIAGRDSLYIKVLGPFGIELMRLFSSEEKFKLYNSFQNEAYEGKPSQENLKKVSNINLSFKDLVKISRSEVPGNSSEYKFTGESEDKMKIYESKINGITERIKLDILGRIIEYIQFDERGIETLKVNFNDYKNVEGFDLSHRIEISFQELGGNMKIEAEEVLINTIGNSPISFTIPESVNVEVIE